MEPITADDFIVTEHGAPAEEIADRYKATMAADGDEKRREFVKLLASVAAPVAVHEGGEFISATWWTGDIADGLDRARRR